MAQVRYYIADFVQRSYFKSWTRNNYGSITHGYTTPNSNTIEKSVVISGLPSGTVINWAKVYHSDDLGTFGGTQTPASGSSVSATIGGTVSISFYWKSNTSGSYPSEPSGDNADTTYYLEKTGILTRTGIYVLVDYTPPDGSPPVGDNPPSDAPPVEGSTTAAVLNNVTLDTHTTNYYSVPGGGITMQWLSAGGSNNPILYHNIWASDDGGAWYPYSFEVGAKSILVYAYPDPAHSRQFLVQAIAAYGSSAQVASPVVYSYSKVSTPEWISLSVPFAQAGTPVTLSWGASSNGAGTSVVGYHIYESGGLLTSVAGTAYTFIAPAINKFFQVYAISNISGYNSAASPGIAFSVKAPPSTGELNKASVPMDADTTIQIALSVNDATYSHVVTWYVKDVNGDPLAGGVEQSIAAGVNLAVTTLPLAWCSYFPNTIMGTAWVKLATYDDELLIGTKYYSYGVTIPTDIKPTVSLAIDPVDGFTGLYLRGESKVVLTSIDAGVYGSTIVSRALYGAGYSGSASPFTTGILNTVGINVLTCVVTDSRGRTATAQEEITVTDYAAPIISAVSAIRSLENGTLDNDGTCAKVTSTLSVTSLSENNPIASAIVEYRLRGDVSWTLGTNALVSATASVVGDGLIAINSTYEIRISLTDTVGRTSTHTMIIPPSTRLYDFRNDRAGIGRVAGATTKQFVLPDDWTSNVNADLLDGNHATAFAAASHPHGNIANDGKVGTVAGQTLKTGADGLVTAGCPYDIGDILQTKNATSPATRWPGTTWAALGGRMLIGVDGTYTIGLTGGAATHTLITAEMPSHTHPEYGSLNTTAQGYVMDAKNATVGTDVLTNSITGATGGGSAHNNMPPYLAVYMWERTA